MEGKVKFFNTKKGFGFIHGDDEKDYFVHISAVPRGVFLRENDSVTFDAAEGDRGLKAENVQLVGGSSAGAGSSAPAKKKKADQEDEYPEESEGSEETEEAEEETEY